MSGSWSGRRTRSAGRRTLPEVELLEWDSEFWGVRIAKADSPDIDEWARDLGVACVYHLAPAENAAAARAAEDAGFRLTDVRVELERPSERSDQPVRPHRDDDVERLRAIARVNHGDTRFYADPNFADERCDDLYETWIRRSCEGWADAVLVAGEAEPVGYVSLHARGDSGSIGLIGVDASARGRGIGEALVRGAVDWCAEGGLPRCTVVTQGRNVAAQRLFQRCGFRTSSLGLWFHKWYDA